MRLKGKSKIWLGGILLFVLGAAFFAKSSTVWKWYLPYIDTANYNQMMKQYDQFSGVPLEKAIQLLTKDECYVIVAGNNEKLGLQEILSPYEQADTNGWSVLCFPVQNTRSREECFVKSFLVDENNIIIGPIDMLPLSTDLFFWMVRDRTLS